MKTKRKDERGREILYGVHAVKEALSAGTRAIDRAWISSFDGGEPALKALVKELEQRSIQPEVVSRKDLSRLCRSQDHNGIAASASPYRYAGMDGILTAIGSEPALVLVLDRIQDPNNLGAILRTAECSGVHGIFIPSRHAAGITPAVVRASAGASEYVRIARVGSIANLIGRLKKAGMWIFGLEEGGDSVWTGVDLTESAAIVMGSEGRGLRRLVRERCDCLVSLPTKGQVECLNVSVACGIVLYEAVRQRADFVVKASDAANVPSERSPDRLSEKLGPEDKG
ncbi:23S rRNA (guanosine(2251)-2'-O)-methyltransferase RlmB [Acidobacteriota bacterium]